MKEIRPLASRATITVYEGTGWKLFISTGDMRELLCEEVFAPRPKGYSARNPSSKTAVAIEFDLIEPFLALGKLLNRQRIHWLDEVNLGRRESVEVFHEDWRQ